MYSGKDINSLRSRSLSRILIWPSEQLAQQIYSVLVEWMRSKAVRCGVDHLECGDHGIPDIILDPFLGTRLVDLVPESGREEEALNTQIR
jgi:hypothetical protein